MSRQSRALSSLTLEEQKETRELNNLLYMPHSTAIVDQISLADISPETDTDPVLSRVRDLVKKGARVASKDNNAKVRKFNPILSD